MVICFEILLNFKTALLIAIGLICDLYNAPLDPIRSGVLKCDGEFKCTIHKYETHCYLINRGTPCIPGQFLKSAGKVNIWKLPVNMPNHHLKLHVPGQPVKMAFT